MVIGITNKQHTCLLFVVIAVASLLACYTTTTQAKVVERFTRHGPGLHYLAKFCYNEGHGDLHWNASPKKGNFNGHVYAMLFDDEPSSWPSVEDSNNCTKIKARSKQTWMVGHDQYERVHITDHTPRYWYIALFQCESNSKQHYELDYRIEFLNGGGWWSDQFSFDVQGMMATYLTLAIGYFFLVMASFVGFMLKKSESKLNHLHRIYGIIILLMECSFWALFIDHAVYADDGVGLPGLQGFGQILELCAMLMFMWLLLLLAKGWMVTTECIQGKRLLSLGFCFFLVLFITLFIWDNLGIAEESTYNVYETIPSILSLVTRFLLWCCFVYFIYESWRRYDDASSNSSFNPIGSKPAYCIVLFVIGTAWFLALPFFVLVTLGAPLYQRFKTTAIVYLAITAVVQLLLGLWLYVHDSGASVGGNTWLGGHSIFEVVGGDIDNHTGPAPIVIDEAAARGAPRARGNDDDGGAGRGVELGVMSKTAPGNDKILDGNRSHYDTL